MKRPLQKICINEQKRELLYTLSLYKILQDRKQNIVIGKAATWQDVTAALLRIMYAAYLNAIEVRQIDDEDYNPERLKYIDFVIWSEEQPEEFAEQIKICFFFVTGKDLETEKKKSTQEQRKNLEKISFLAKIGKKFSRS